MTFEFCLLYLQSTVYSLKQLFGGSMEISIISWLQNNFFQYLIYILSYAGHLFVLLGVAAVIYITINKSLGEKLLIFYFTSMFFNALLKDWIGRPRPYHKGAHTIIEHAEQFSMPSGHAQGFASFLVPFTQTAKNKRKAYIVASILLLFICFTRLYLGQHYLTDVLVGAAIGVIIAIGLELIYRFAGKYTDFILLGIIPVVIVMLSIFHFRDAYVSGGILCGALIGIFFEKRFVKYEINGSAINRILKMLFALLIISTSILPAVLLRSILSENLFLVILFALMGFALTFLCPLLIKIAFRKKQQKVTE